MYTFFKNMHILQAKDYSTLALPSLLERETSNSLEIEDYHAAIEQAQISFKMLYGKSEGFYANFPK